jgi:high-affinity iron transporter
MQKKWQTKLSLNLSKNIQQQQQEGLEHEEDEVLHELTDVSCPTHERTGLKKWIKMKTAKYSLMILPLVTLMREGLEAIFVISGVSASEPLSSLPLSIITSMTLGILIGVSLYKGGNKMRLQFFLIGSTCFLYLVSAGLMSRGVWFFELEKYVQNCHGQDMTEVGNGAGSYDIANTIWHVNCCSGVNDGGWMLLNAIVGWNNTATYGSVISYNLYWVFIVIMLKAKLHQERSGYLPFLPIKWQLKKIRKRYNLIKYNIDNNVNYKSTSSGVENDSVVHPNGDRRLDGIDERSDSTTSLLATTSG